MKKLYIIIFASILYFSNFHNAQALIGLDKPFGGKSVLVTICSCDMTFMVSMFNLQNNVYESFIYQPGVTTLYANYLFMMTDVNMLGLADTFPTACMNASPSGCTPTGYGYKMQMLGTSL